MTPYGAGQHGILRPEYLSGYPFPFSRGLHIGGTLKRFSLIEVKTRMVDVKDLYGDIGGDDSQ